MGESWSQRVDANKRRRSAGAARDHALPIGNAGGEHEAAPENHLQRGAKERRLHPRFWILRQSPRAR